MCYLIKLFAIFAKLFVRIFQSDTKRGLPGLAVFYLSLEIFNKKENVSQGFKQNFSPCIWWFQIKDQLDRSNTRKSNI